MIPTLRPETPIHRSPSVLEFNQHLSIDAPPNRVFDSLIRHLTVDHRGGPDSPALPLELEPRPGGRWFRNFGEGNGHLWGFVQSYRPPTLLEIFGPLFMSYPVSGHLIVRVEPSTEGSLLSFNYSALGLLQEDHRDGLQQGFLALLKSVQSTAESQENDE